MTLTVAQNMPTPTPLLSRRFGSGKGGPCPTLLAGPTNATDPAFPPTSPMAPGRRFATVQRRASDGMPVATEGGNSCTTLGQHRLIVALTPTAI